MQPAPDHPDTQSIFLHLPRISWHDHITSDFTFCNLNDTVCLHLLNSFSYRSFLSVHSYLTIILPQFISKTFYILTFSQKLSNITVSARPATGNFFQTHGNTENLPLATFSCILWYKKAMRTEKYIFTSALAHLFMSAFYFFIHFVLSRYNL